MSDLNKRSNKLKTREAAMKLKNGSPKVQEIIRARCKLRLSEARRKSFDMGRNFGNLEDLKDAMSDIILDEMSILEANLKTEDDMLRELMLHTSVLSSDDELDGIIQSLMTDGVICPCCEKNFMQNDSQGFIICRCGLKLRQGNVNNLQWEIQARVNDHTQICESNPQFIFVPEGDIQSILLICSNCNFSKHVF